MFSKRKFLQIRKILMKIIVFWGCKAMLLANRYWTSST